MFLQLADRDADRGLGHGQLLGGLGDAFIFRHGDKNPEMTQGHDDSSLIRCFSSICNPISYLDFKILEFRPMRSSTR